MQYDVCQISGCNILCHPIDWSSLGLPVHVPGLSYDPSEADMQPFKPSSDDLHDILQTVVGDLGASLMPRLVLWAVAAHGIFYSSHLEGSVAL